MGIGNISEGLGKLTPQVWQRLGNAVDFAERSSPDLLSRRAKQPVWPSCLAVITGFELQTLDSGALSPETEPPNEGKILNPRRIFLYTWKEVMLTYQPTLDEDKNQTQTLTVTEQGRESGATDGDFTMPKAVNGMEFGLPTTRDASFGGVMIGPNDYPPKIAVVPTIHFSTTNTAGVTETQGTGYGPIVMMHFVEAKKAITVADDPKDNEYDNDNQASVVPIFFSPPTLDGPCE